MGSELPNVIAITILIIPDGKLYVYKDPNSFSSVCKIQTIFYETFLLNVCIIVEVNCSLITIP